MRLFAYAARLAFRDAPDGRRVFYRGGPFSRPYIVPDNDTEQDLFAKRLWMMRLLFAYIFLIQPLFLYFVPQLINDTAWFLGYVCFVSALFWCVGHFMLRGQLIKLEQLKSRMSIHDYFCSIARGSKTSRLALGFVVSCLLVIGCVWMLLSGMNAFISLAFAGFFSTSALILGYPLLLKIHARIVNPT